MILDNVNAIELVSPAYRAGSVILNLAPGLPKSPYFVKNIEGLEPPDYDVNMSDNAFEGRTYHGQKPVGRRIVITLGFRPAGFSGQTISSLRQDLYSMMDTSSGYPITIRLLSGYSLVNGVPTSTGYQLAYTTAYTAKIAANVFTKSPDVILTLDSEDGYFQDVAATRLTFPSLNFTVDNPGTTSTGLYLEFLTSIAASSFTIKETAHYPNQTFKVTKAFALNERIQMDSSYGAKSIYSFANDGTTKINILPYLTTSDWFVLRPGLNTFVSSNSAATYTRVAVEYRARYLGV